MGETVRFHFDPGCPWAWQTSRWMREVARLLDLRVEWRLFSLKLVNDPDDDPLADAHAKGIPALRTLALVRREAGDEMVGALYEALGEHVHERAEPFGHEVIRQALSEVGLEPSLMDRALADETTSADVRRDHEAAAADVGAFGVPTIVLESGRGIFGPVVATAPMGDDAVELWKHVRYVIEQDGFYELKRTRDRKPASREPA